MIPRSLGPTYQEFIFEVMIRNFLITFFIFQQLQSQISQFDKKWTYRFLRTNSSHIHCQFSLHYRDISIRDNGFADFHTVLPGSPLIRANKTKRELMDCHTRRK